MMEFCDCGSLEDANTDCRKCTFLNSTHADPPPQPSPPSPGPHLIPILTWQETHIVMEFCDCGSLEDATTDGRLADASGADVNLELLCITLLEVCRAMEYLHKMHITHRDLKLANVLLKSDPVNPLTTLCLWGCFVFTIVEECPGWVLGLGLCSLAAWMINWAWGTAETTLWSSRKPRLAA